MLLKYLAKGTGAVPSGRTRLGVALG